MRTLSASMRKITDRRVDISRPCAKFVTLVATRVLVDRAEAGISISAHEVSREALDGFTLS